MFYIFSCFNEKQLRLAHSHIQGVIVRFFKTNMNTKSLFKELTIFILNNIFVLFVFFYYHAHSYYSLIHILLFICINSNGKAVH